MCVCMCEWGRVGGGARNEEGDGDKKIGNYILSSLTTFYCCLSVTSSKTASI